MAAWQPMYNAPKDGTPILAICQHFDEDEKRLYEWDRKALSRYFASYPNGHVKDGPNVIVWGGGYDDSPEGSAPDWWFQYGSDFEIAANPVWWMPVEDLPTYAPAEVAQTVKLYLDSDKGELWLWGNDFTLSFGMSHKSTFDNWIWHPVKEKYTTLKFVSTTGETFIRERK